MSTAQAHEYAALGYGVLPVQPLGKVPATRNGLKDATTDLARISQWPERCNVGIVPPERVLVLDADTREEVERLEREHPELRCAPRQDTPSGGAHIWTLLPPGVKPPKTSTRVQGRALDLRGLNKTYLVVSPSKTPKGSYRWARPLVSPDQLPETPSGVLALLTPPERVSAPPPKYATPVPPDGDRSRRYALAALQAEHDTVASAAKGKRNDTLNRAAFALGQLAGAGALERDEVEEALRTAAQTCGLDPRETETTLKGGLEAGIAQPREIPKTNGAAPNHSARHGAEQLEAISPPWEAVLELPMTAPAVPTLSTEMIPEPLRLWVDDVAERLCVHREYIAVPALVSLGAVVGRTVGIHPKQFDDWLEALIKRLLSPELEATPAFHAHLSKYPSLMPSLALIFHLIDIADRTAPGPVSADAADLAAAWCDFLELHARKLYALELNREAASAHALAERIRQGEVQDGVKVSDLYQHKWPGLKTADEVATALVALEACHWLRVEEIPNSGARPTKQIRLNSDAIGG